jgi:hypothetical protein
VPLGRCLAEWNAAEQTHTSVNDVPQVIDCSISNESFLKRVAGHADICSCKRRISSDLWRITRCKGSSYQRRKI